MAQDSIFTGFLIEQLVVCVVEFIWHFIAHLECLGYYYFFIMQN